MLKQSGASGVIHKGKGVQIVYGPQVSVVKSNLDDFLDSDEKNVSEIRPEDTGRKEKNVVDCELFSPLCGKLVNLEDVKDEAFSNKILGEVEYFTSLSTFAKISVTRSNLCPSAAFAASNTCS
jgi:PTS system D-glucosamine-specific IIC component